MNALSPGRSHGCRLCQLFWWWPVAVFLTALAAAGLALAAAGWMLYRVALWVA